MCLTCSPLWPSANSPPWRKGGQNPSPRSCTFLPSQGTIAEGRSRFSSRGHGGLSQRWPMQETILQSVGKTPLVKLRRVTEGLAPAIYAKVEAMNPGGSVKDRVALAMIGEAERRGWLRPAGTIIQATASQTCVRLSLTAPSQCDTPL